jgi:ABC-type multidrug transport system fused ATPase/permease subunit
MTDTNQTPNALDLDTDLNFRQTCGLVGRGLRYIRFFKMRFGAKFFLMWLSLLSPLILPWPVKIVIDNVILGMPIGEGTVFPPYFMPFVSFLEGRSPIEIMAWVLLLGASWIILFGAFGSGGGASDQTDGFLAEGHDTATTTENEANEGSSKVAGLMGMLEYRINLRLTQSLNHLMRAQLFERINHLPMRLLNDQHIGDSVYRMMYDTPSITNVFYQVIISPTVALATAFIILAVMSYSYGDAPEIIWIALLTLPVQILAMLPWAKITREKSQASREAGSVTTGNIEEGMSNVLAVQSLGGNKRERERFDKDSKESFRRFRVQFFVQLLFQVCVWVGTASLGLVAFYVISSLVIEGKLTPGDYGVLIYYYNWLAGTMRALPYVWYRIQHSIPGIRRVFFLMDLPTESARAGLSLGRITNGIEFRNVSYDYPDGRRALEQVNLTANVGEILALVGPTGAGKTTLAYLVPGFYDATDGEVLIDGHNVNDISLQNLRSQVSYVFQETQLFSDSILDNIRYGNTEASQEDVERVAKIAGAHDFITSLPNGYQSKLGTVTSKLSVGQKQRISIARGLLKDASVLILDEPTSALDPETETYLVNALHEAAKDKLVIIIAHRLSTIAHADNIVFLENGQVMEQGSHQQLLENADGYYSHFVALQASRG